MIVDSADEIASPPLFMRLRRLLPHCPVYLKIEGLNLAGSIKLKTARQLIGDLEAAAVLRPGKHVIESSSGNLGVALAFICAQRGYPFTCVTDPNVSPATERLIRALRARVIVVRERDPVGGFLQSRLDVIQDLLRGDPRLVWTNQYAAASNHWAHYQTTGPEILQSFPRPDWVFIGTGTTGTLTGCARYLREHAPSTRVVAVDPVGSVTFGGAPGPRYLPGIGTSRRPELADQAVLDELILVAERDAVQMCRNIARQHGILLGASTGSVLCAVQQARERIGATDTVIAIGPDLGDRYIDTLYRDEWVEARFPQLVSGRDHDMDVLESQQPADAACLAGLP